MAFSANSLISHSNGTLNLRPLPILSKLQKTHLCESVLLPCKPPCHHKISSCSRPTMSASSTSVAKTAPDFYLQESSNLGTVSASGKSWPQFAEKVSGEWDGYGADFTPEGKPIELPELVVPDAYKEWEVRVFDWQTQCPTLAQPQEQDPSIIYKLIKLLPTVGCEADAATRYTIEERNAGGTSNKALAFAYQSSGCYIAVWPIEDDKMGAAEMMELEYCLVDPKNRESRVRITQVVSVNDSKLVLRNIRVFREQWYGPFRNGDQLGGCAIRDSTFATTDTLKGFMVHGTWSASNAVAGFQDTNNDLIKELAGDSAREFVRNENDLVLLPKQLWSSIKEMVDCGTCSEVGWILDKGCAITSRCIFSSDLKLKEMSIACETAVFENV